MVTLDHCMSARSFRPLWMLEELGAPYELKMLPFPPRAFDKTCFAVNPWGPRFTPEAARYWERLRARDGFIRALAAQEGAASAQGISAVAAPDLRPGA